MTIYRVPTPEEAGAKNYKEIFDKVKILKSENEKIFVEKLDNSFHDQKYSVFEFSMPELKEKLLEEYENFHKELYDIVEARDGYSAYHFEKFYFKLSQKIKSY